MTPTNEEILKQAAKEQKRQEKKKQVIAFATGTLGLSGKKAKALRKLGSDYFKLADDGLRFRGAGDRLVAIDSKECTEFFKKKFDYLLTPVADTATSEPGALDADLIEKARTNVTARGELFKQLHGNNIDTPIQNAVTKQKLDALLSKPVEKKLTNGANPWAKDSFNITAQGKLTAVLIKAHGEAEGLKRAEAIAAAAGSHIGATKPAKV